MKRSVKKKIVIVECWSSSFNYIHDIYERGYEPVLLEAFTPDEYQDGIQGIPSTQALKTMENIAYIFQDASYPLVLMAKENYNDTLEMIREIEPILIFPGSDPGQELALRLSADLGLKSNPLSILWNMRDKLTMQERLKSCGIRSIQTCPVRSEEAAVDFFRNQKKRVVIKPTQSSGSRNVFICESEDEVRRAYSANEQFVKMRAMKKEQVIVQECIDGQEFVVDTISCAGRHVALFGIQYIKRLCKGHGMIYDTDIYISPDDPSLKELVDYCFQVLTCLGIRYGPVHSEFIVDEKGPVLVEVNARPAGVIQRYTFQDKVMEIHETAAGLDSYFMSEEEFCARYPERMHLKQAAAVKQICLNESIYVEKVKIKDRLSRLDSFDYAIDNGDHCIYPKTTDLDSNGGMIYLTAPDQETLEKDLAEILRLEKEGLDELYDWRRT